MIERPRCVNNFRGGSVRYTAMNSIALLLNWVLRGQSFQYVLVYNFTNMHAMSHRSDLFACSSRVDIYEPAFCITITWLSAVSRVGLYSCLNATAMSDSKSSNTLMPDVMISSKNECGIVCDLSDLPLQIILDAWWASMNVDSKCPIAWNDSRHASSWRSYLHCGIEETRSRGIPCIVRHQDLRHPSEHGTSSMGKHLLAKAHIAEWNKLTESEVTELTSSTVDETVSAILTRHGSRGITVVSSQRTMIFDI